MYYEPKFVSELAARYNVKIWSCHLPFRPFDVNDASSLDKETRKKAFGRYSEEIRKGTDAGIDIFVMHPGTPFENERERPERLKCAIRIA